MNKKEKLKVAKQIAELERKAQASADVDNISAEIENIISHLSMTDLFELDELIMGMLDKNKKI